MRVVISSASTGSSADAGPLAELREFGSVGTRSAGPSAYAVTEMQAKPNRTAEASLMPSHLEKENASTVAVGPCGRDARIGRVVYFWIDGENNVFSSAQMRDLPHLRMMQSC